MSRIGKLPIVLPAGVTVTINGQQVSAQGPKGHLSLSLPAAVHAELNAGRVRLMADRPEQQHQRALWGLCRALVANMVTGVSQGYQKRLEISGVGYRATVSGQVLTLHVGRSHPVEFPIPTGITVVVEKNIISVAGIDKQQVGATAAKIRAVRRPEPYKGKGIKYADELIRRKAGKVVKATGTK